MMKKNTISTLYLIFVSLCGFSAHSQEKKWSIEDCLTYAFEHNISIKQSDLDVQGAEVDKRQAIGNFLPSINGTASHTWNSGLNQCPATGLFVNQTTQFTSLGLGSSVPIYAGLQNQNRLRRANLANLAAQYKLSKMKDDVSLNVANAFLQILFNKEQLSVQKEQLANNQKQIQRTEELVKAGSNPRGDLLDMKATLATNQQAVVVAENSLLISRLSLAQLLQLPDFQQFDTQDNEIELRESKVMLQTPSEIFKVAKEIRYELKIAKTNLELAERDVKIARGAYQPTLNGIYNLQATASSGQIVTFGATGTPTLGPPLPIDEQLKNNKSTSVGLQLKVPILNGLTARNNVARMKIALERSRIAFTQTELDLERNVYTAFTDAKGALNAYESAVTTLEARSEAFNYAKEKYNVGMLSAFDLNQSQTLYINAKSESLRTKYDYIFKVKVLEFYFGIPIVKK